MSVDPKRVQSIFVAAADLPVADDRAAYLDQACAGDSQLRHRVEALLQAHDNPDSWLPPPAARSEGTVDSPPAAGSPGTRPPETAGMEQPGTILTGRYKLLEQIGQGGMGAVWMSQQTEPVKRLVALKVIKPGMDSKPVLARFEAERQALALMDHPNIAKVLDGGQTGSGRPYFVMDLVKGLPITDYCNQNQLTPRERLELFADVCSAVQHAHQKGIIHRDIKPSNVLVTMQDGKPLVKVIDFGIAKALGQQLSDKTVFTGFAQMIGTPLYMSPEQAALSNVDVDTRSDVYSLGVLLYELLTGTTPFTKERLQQAGYDEMRRIIREEEPPKPSTRLSTLGQAAATVAAHRRSDPKRLRQFLRGELDWIVMKALEKDRSRRYETASAFAGDVQRYLHDEPVAACPPSAWYRCRKFARRNRVALAMASVVTVALVLLLAGLATGLVLLGRANARIEEQRDLANQNFHEALRAVDDYFTHVSENTLLKSPLPGLQPLRKQLLGTALKYYQGFAEKHRDDAALQAELARAYFRVALINEELGAKPEALKAYREARDVWEKLRQDDPANPTYPHELAQCYGRLGSLQSRSADEGENGLASLQQACALAEAVAGSYRAQRDYQKTLARTYHQLGLWQREHESPEAPLSLGKALKAWEQLVRDEPQLELQVATVSKDLGYYHSMRGEAEAALAFHGRARDIVEKWARQKPTDFEIRRLLRYVYKNLGYVHDARTRRYEEARNYYAKVLELDEQLARENPAVPDFQRVWAGDLLQMGELICSSTGNYAQAATLAQQGLQHLERLNREHPHDPEIQKGLRTTSLFLSKAQAKAGQSEEASRSLQRFRALLAQLEQDSAAMAAIIPFDYAEDYLNLGLVEQDTGQTAEALRSLGRAVELYRKILIESPRHQLALGCLVETYCRRGVLQRRAGRLKEAAHSFQEARSLLTKLSSQDAGDHYNEAVACAQLSFLASESAEKRTLTEAAMAALRQALAAGFMRVAELKTSPDLDPLRSRKDFQELLAEVGEKR
jgi:serine/threonine protein kinase/tetratricopeptide (TPR) repeat protein